MKHLKLFEEFGSRSKKSESLNEGAVAIGLGLMAAISIARFILKVVRGVKGVKMLTNTLLGMTRFNAGVGFGVKNLETGKVDKHEALEVIEYDDRYFLKFKGPFKGEIDNIRVLKNERILLIDQDGKMIKVPLTPANYDEFISIIKHKLK